MSQDARADEEQSTLKRARLLGLNYVDTSQADNKSVYKDILSNEEMYRLRLIPIVANENNIVFGITTTTSQQTMRDIAARFTDQRISFTIISDSGYRDYMRLYDPPKKVTYQDINITASNVSDSSLQTVSSTLEQVRSDDVLAYLVKQAYQLNASDIHLENQKNKVRIRFRVDGVLHLIATLSKEKYHQVVSSIAVAANISTDSPDAQSGHINSVYKMATGEDVTLNLRVETVPAAFGQDVVMRLFNVRLELLKLDNLGLSDSERKVVDDIITHPTGMVLVVGPTGSGKTTTLYSLINTLRSDERKIITLEDPIEYYLDGIVQIPVNGDKNESGFADKLRAVLRLDPDILMVGEIRDQDTARAALQAALTGHLVLSTFHGSSASAALTRMLDFVGVNPLFASSIHLIMAQRLVRRLDDETKQPYQLDDGMRQQLQPIIDSLPPGVDRPDLNEATLFKSGSSEKNPFGYSGQLAIREQLLMTEGIQQILRLLPNQVTTTMIEEKAISDGMLTMLQDGILKALSGATTLEEIYRVVG